MEARIRVLVPKPGPDGRDRGTKVIAQARHDSGTEVMDKVLRQMLETITIAALQEDVRVIRLSTVAGARTAIVPRLTHLVHDRGTDSVVVAETVSHADVSGSMKMEVVAVPPDTGHWKVSCSSSATTWQVRTREWKLNMKRGS